MLINKGLVNNLIHYMASMMNRGKKVMAIINKKINIIMKNIKLSSMNIKSINKNQNTKNQKKLKHLLPKKSSQGFNDLCKSQLDKVVYVFKILYLILSVNS
jgi:hypothetical protein